MDNRHWDKGCPPLMSDGRFVTNYVDSDVLVQFIRHVNKIESSQDFKNFMIKNAESIMEKERKFVTSKNMCEVHGECSNHNNKKVEGFTNTSNEVNVMNYLDERNRFNYKN